MTYAVYGCPQLNFSWNLIRPWNLWVSTIQFSTARVQLNAPEQIALASPTEGDYKNNAFVAVFKQTINHRN